MRQRIHDFLLNSFNTSNKRMINYANCQLINTKPYFIYLDAYNNWQLAHSLDHSFIVKNLNYFQQLTYGLVTPVGAQEFVDACLHDDLYNGTTKTSTSRFGQTDVVSRVDISAIIEEFSTREELIMFLDYLIQEVHTGWVIRDKTVCQKLAKNRNFIYEKATFRSKSDSFSTFTITLTTDKNLSLLVELLNSIGIDALSFSNYISKNNYSIVLPFWLLTILKTRVQFKYEQADNKI